MQGELEAQADKRLENILNKVNGRKKKSERGNEATVDKDDNAFFPGLAGDLINADEATLLEKTNRKATNDSDDSDDDSDEDGADTLTFCLPCDLKNEVSRSDCWFSASQASSAQPSLFGMTLGLGYFLFSASCIPLCMC